MSFNERMPRSLLIVIPVVVLVMALGAGALWTSLRPPVSPGTATERSGRAPAAPGGESAATVSIRPRSGRVMPLDEAMKTLDLIRPSRQKAAEDFTAPLVGGETFKLTEHRGKVIFINFWATWCPPCREEMPAMERLWKQQAANGLVMVAVSVDTKTEAIPPFLKEHGLTFPVALDSKMDIANAYGVRALPASFVIDRKGDLAALALGPRAWDSDAAHSLVEALAK